MGKLKSIFFLTYTLNNVDLSALAGTQNRRYIGRKQKI